MKGLQMMLVKRGARGEISGRAQKFRFENGCFRVFDFRRRFYDVDFHGANCVKIIKNCVERSTTQFPNRKCTTNQLAFVFAQKVRF